MHPGCSQFSGGVEPRGLLARRTRDGRGALKARSAQTPNPSWGTGSPEPPWYLLLGRRGQRQGHFGGRPTATGPWGQPGSRQQEEPQSEGRLASRAPGSRGVASGPGLREGRAHAQPSFRSSSATAATAANTTTARAAGCAPSSGREGAGQPPACPGMFELLRTGAGYVPTALGGAPLFPPPSDDSAGGQRGQAGLGTQDWLPPQLCSELGPAHRPPTGR